MHVITPAHNQRGKEWKTMSSTSLYTLVYRHPLVPLCHYPSDWLTTETVNTLPHIEKREIDAVTLSPANNTRPFKKTAFRAKQKQKTEHEVPRCRDTLLSITPCWGNGMSKPICKKNNVHPRNLLHKRRSRLCVFQAVTLDSAVLWSASLQILVDWICACSADDVKFAKLEQANSARANERAVR